MREADVNRKATLWTEEQESRRIAYIAAGLAPYLNPVWASVEAGALIAARDEYRAKAHLFEPALRAELERTADEIDIELAYRESGEGAA